jgi:serine/threonine protein kinase
MKEEIVCKIADLGFAKKLAIEEVTYTYCGTPLSMAPEVILGHPYTSKADIWSLGCIFYQLLTGCMPFNGTNLQELKTKLKDGTWYIPSKVKLSDDCIDFLDSCLKFDENERIDWA